MLLAAAESTLTYESLHSRHVLEMCYCWEVVIRSICHISYSVYNRYNSR